MAGQKNSGGDCPGAGPERNIAVERETRHTKREGEAITSIQKAAALLRRLYREGQTERLKRVSNLIYDRLGERFWRAAMSLRCPPNCFPPKPEK